jgi:hypothetical protein
VWWPNVHQLRHVDMLFEFFVKVFVGPAVDKSLQLDCPQAIQSGSGDMLTWQHESARTLVVSDAASA